MALRYTAFHLAGSLHTLTIGTSEAIWTVASVRSGIVYADARVLATVFGRALVYIF